MTDEPKYINLFLEALKAWDEHDARVKENIQAGLCFPSHANGAGSMRVHALRLAAKARREMRKYLSEQCTCNPDANPCSACSQLIRFTLA
jgi:hypothetical protein